MRISGGTTGGLWAAPGTSLALSLVTQRREPHQLPGCSGYPGASQPQGHGGAEAGGDIEVTQPRAACTVLGTVGFPISPWRETLLPLRAARARL